MKKLLVLVLVVAVAGGGWLFAAHLSGGALFTFGLPIGGDRGFIREASMSFFEDIQFKDFKTAAKYHSPQKQDTVDIPALLQRLFAVKPEALDIMSYEIVFAEIDSTGNRARVKCRVKVKELAQMNIREQEVILYYKRAGPGAPWYMELEDSLRSVESDPNKKT